MAVDKKSVADGIVSGGSLNTGRIEEIRANDAACGVAALEQRGYGQVYQDRRDLLAALDWLADAHVKLGEKMGAAADRQALFLNAITAAVADARKR